MMTGDEDEPKDEPTTQQRQDFEAYYATLSSSERRERIFLNPVFRDHYNRISQAHRQFPIPSYLWERWVPELGLLPVAVYVELRRMCFVNNATGERRTIVWPKQETLGKRLGVKKRHTIGAALKVLEENGFIRRHRTTYNDKQSGRVRRGVTEYDVMWEFPLLPADAVELLIAQTVTRGSEDGGNRMAEKRPFGTETVDNSHRRAEKRPQPHGRKTAVRTITRTTNVINVNEKPDSDFRNDPRVLAMSPEERTGREQLTLELGQRLHDKERRTDPHHRSEGFHRRVAYFMSRAQIEEALASITDATTGGGSASDPSGYFAGAIKKIAQRDGIDLGIKTTAKATT